MNYLLDTCIISELVKPEPNTKVIDWLDSIANDRLFLSVITIGEIRKGITKLKESKKKSQLENWLNTLLEDYQSRIYSINLTVAENWGILQGTAEKDGKPMASLDSLIASIAYTYNLIIVTRNESDFKPSNLPLHNPWLQ